MAKKPIVKYKKSSPAHSAVVKEPAIAFTGTPLNRFEVLHRLSASADSRILVKKVLDATGLPLTFLASEVFEVTPKTLAGYKTRKTVLNTRFTETCAELEQLYKKGKQLFGSLDAFNQWMHIPSYGLGNRIPVKLLSSSAGISLIFDELTRIEHGVLA